ncbi:MAG: hypothetical protein D6795_10645 [Deltaproteobacteria bacterium]|nr:MAG: hypothetical protein D6795_10645 [Deltaproteobacteria bacterium]
MVRTFGIMAAIILFTLSPRLLWACPVCFGGADGPVAEGVNMAILFLLGVTGVVLSGFIALILIIRHRSRACAEVAKG